LAKAALVPSAKAALRIIAADNIIFLVVSIAFSFPILIGDQVQRPNQVPQSPHCIVNLIDYSVARRYKPIG